MLKMTPILVTTQFTSESSRRVIKKALSIARNGIREDLRKPTRTWEEKPSFKTFVRESAGAMTVEVFLSGDTPGNQHYLWLDEGVAEHPVIKSEGQLAFPETFSAKTIPGTLSSRQGIRSDKNKVLPTGYGVMVEIEARNFTKQVEQIWDIKFQSIMQQALNEIAIELSK